MNVGIVKASGTIGTGNNGTTELLLVRERPWFGTTTVSALETRGVLRYCEWVFHDNEMQFPVRAKLKDSA